MGINRVFLIVIDGLGMGALPDAGDYGDEDADTLGNLAEAVGGLGLRFLESLGLGRIRPLRGVSASASARGFFGRMAELAPAKDTLSGHWEMMGLVRDRPAPVYPSGFPPELIRLFERETGLGVLGNRPASGTVIIEQLGTEHLRTGKPIVYTSADSVFQVAAHKDIIGLDRLYEICEAARTRMLVGEHAVDRVIARPFVGEPGAFRRTAERHDYPVDPPGPTVLDRLAAAGIGTVGVGKISDIFAGRGVARSLPTDSNASGLEVLHRLAAEEPEAGLIFANLVDTDSIYGHRNDAEGFYRALRELDAGLARLMAVLGPDDVMIVTGDHGCDPTTRSTDHSREYVPIMGAGAGIRSDAALGTRGSFADLGAFLAAVFGVEPVGPGRDFSGLVLGGMI